MFGEVEVLAFFADSLVINFGNLAINPISSDLPNAAHRQFFGGESNSTARRDVECGAYYLNIIQQR